LQFSGTELHPAGSGLGLLSVKRQEVNPLVLQLKIEHSLGFILGGLALKLKAFTLTEFEHATGPTEGTPGELTVTCPVFSPAVE
jgi:hypothetical protein